MKTFCSAATIAGLAMGIASTLVAGNAQAVSQGRYIYANATAFCQPALPTFDGNIRKRPLAVQNEGSSNAFITCSLLAQGLNTITLAGIYAASNDGAAHSLTCTGITGYNTGTNEAVVKTVELPASGGQVQLVWEAGDFDGAPAVFPSSLFNVSCNLAPGVGLNDIYTSFSEDVGS